MEFIWRGIEHSGSSSERLLECVFLSSQVVNLSLQIAYFSLKLALLLNMKVLLLGEFGVHFCDFAFQLADSQLEVLFISFKFTDFLNGSVVLSFDFLYLIVIVVVFDDSFFLNDIFILSKPSSFHFPQLMKFFLQLGIFISQTFVGQVTSEGFSVGSNLGLHNCFSEPSLRFCFYNMRPSGVSRRSLSVTDVGSSLGEISRLSQRNIGFSGYLISFFIITIHVSIAQVRFPGSLGKSLFIVSLLVHYKIYFRFLYRYKRRNQIFFCVLVFN